MSKLTDRISYLQGLAEGMKLNPEKDSHRLILGMLEVLGDVGDAYEALAEAHGELSEYVESIDEDWRIWKQISTMRKRKTAMGTVPAVTMRTVSLTAAP
jgi:hypothetical protein